MQGKYVVVELDYALTSDLRKRKEDFVRKFGIASEQAKEIGLADAEEGAVRFGYCRS